MSVLVLVAPWVGRDRDGRHCRYFGARQHRGVAGLSCCPAGPRQVNAVRGVQLVADCHIDELASRDFEAIVVPGGLPGSEVIRDTPLAIDLLKEQAALGRWHAAICAAPVVVVQHHGLLDGAIVTCHPGFQPQLPTLLLSHERVVRDEAHHLITSQGPGSAIEFALELVLVLVLVLVLRWDEVAAAVAGPMVLP